MVNDIIFADISNFTLTLDGLGLFLQNFKTIEPLKIEKWMIHPMEALGSPSFLKVLLKYGGEINPRTFSEKSKLTKSLDQ